MSRSTPGKAWNGRKLFLVKSFFPSYEQFSTTKNGMWNLTISVIEMLYIHIMNIALI